MKRISIWAVTMVVMVFLANLAGTLVNKLLFANTLMPAMTGYSKKMELPLESDGTEQGDKKVKAVIMIRSALSDMVLEDEDPSPLASLVFTDIHIDQSIVFRGPDGMTELSKGIFAPVYEDKGQKTYLLDTIGVLNVSEFSKLECGNQLYEILRDNMKAKVRLDAYAIKDFIVEPAKITVIDEAGNEIKTIDCPCSGDVQKGSNIVILNQYDNDSDSNSLYLKLKCAYLGERSSDREVMELSDSLDFSIGDYDKSGTSYGFGKLTSRYVEVREGRGMALVLVNSFLKDVLIYSGIFCLIATLILVGIFRKRDRKKNDLW